MIKKLFSSGSWVNLLLVIIVLAGSFILASPVLAADIEISNITDLQKIGVDAGYPVDGSYILTTDIDASETATWNSGDGFKPISNETDGGGTPNNVFVGTFDGQGYTITGLVINRPSENFVGLFGISAGSISNLKLVDSTISGGSYVGGIVGGIGGGSDSITNCSSDATITASGDSVGGLTGLNSVGTITNSYVDGSVTGNGSLTGGLVGFNLGGTITGSYSASAVTGVLVVGGLVGSNGGEDNPGTVTNCYATGAVIGTGDAISIGGLIGSNSESSTVTNCYATGAVTGNGTGGLIAYDDGSNTVTGSYWDADTTGQVSSSGGTSKTTVQMKQQTTFSGWDFATTPIWWIDEGNDYPKLQALTSYTLTYTAGDNGSITGDSPQTVLRSADGSAVTAVPATGYQFVSWSDDSTANPRTDTSITANVSVTATFEAIPSSHSSGGSSVSSQVSNLLAMGNTQAAQALMTQYPTLFTNQPIVPTAPTSDSGHSTFAGKSVLLKSADLKTGVSSPFVKLLQQYLNASGFILAKTGPGSPGHETLMFGALTRGALARFQKAHDIKPAVGYFGPITRKTIQGLP
ncbi:MAG: GLUG motif-containing protein [Candidatus Paceibacterota bacterium]|jgi:uncharacterized repeat protein (TIGR02543 family)